jgi:hypothetical protein
MKLRALILAWSMIHAIGCSSSGKPEIISFLDESPVDGSSSMMTYSMNDLSSGSVAGKSMAVMCECARVTLEKGYTYFLVEDQKLEPGGEASFKITFFNEPPEGMPVFSMDSGPGDMGDDDDVVMDAKSYAQLCEMIKGDK